MKIAGFRKQSLIDYQGNISSVVFTQGCNLLCPYCHNPELVLPEKYGELYNANSILRYLENYAHLIDAVCISGGEPCVQKDLPEFIAQIKQMDLKIKLDTNGTFPKMLHLLLEQELLDFVAMDVKHVLSFYKYRKAVGGKMALDQFNKVLKSIVLLKDSEVKHEFRTTIAKGLHTIHDVESLKQQFQDEFQVHNLDKKVMLNKESEYQLEPFSEEELGALVC